MTLTRYGIREWGGMTLGAIAAGVLFGYIGWWWAVGVVALVWFAGAAFFRDPWRVIPKDLAPGDMISPADGTISAVEEVDHHDATGGPAVIVRIFLSVLNVHINRSPCDGEVASITHTPGKYLDARSTESAKVNESNLMVLQRPDGSPIGIRQVSGAIARRIVCDTSAGQLLRRGQRFGMIKFGSTTELIVPPEGATVHVKVGDKVKGGITVLATLG